MRNEGTEVRAEATPQRLPSAACPQVGRRAFLGTAAAVAVGALAGEWSTTGDGEASAESWGPLLASAELAAGEGRHVRGEGSARLVLVVRLLDGALRAFDARCQHLGCPVLWSRQRQRIECPCHQAVFDAQDGGVVTGPPARGLEPLEVYERGGTVFVRV